MRTRYDLVVVGGGPGGYPAAIRAAAEGLSVLLVEKRGLGGECTLYGCVPTKAIVSAASAGVLAARLGGSPPDPLRVFEEARGIAARLSEGIGSLLQRYGVHVAHGFAGLSKDGVVVRERGGAEHVVEAGAVLLAPGTEPSAPPGIIVDNRVVVDNRGWLMHPPRPGDDVLVVGGGPVGVEAAAAAAMLGARVVLLEALPRLLPAAPRGLSLVAARRLRRLGVVVETRCPVEEVMIENGEAVVRHCGSSRRYRRVLVATGRRPNTGGLGLEEVGGALDERGYIRVDPGMATGAPGVYAAGDAAGPPLLAHKAIHQSLVAAENIVAEHRGLEPHARYSPRAVPMVVHLGSVELAWVGVVGEEARRRGYSSTRVRLGWSLYAHLYQGLEGYVEIYYEEQSGRIMGFEAAAPGAADMAATVAVAIEKGLGLEDVASAVFPHPERQEALYEVVVAALGRPLHYYLRRR